MAMELLGSLIDELVKPEGKPSGGGIVMVFVGFWGRLGVVRGETGLSDYGLSGLIRPTAESALNHVRSVWGWGCLFCQKKVSERSEFFFQRKGTPTPEPAPKASDQEG